ncbi:hypothetical protein E6P09_00225 [Haloferax mediterranei ATCC 33500]|uniref:Uncharacterized protein n=1 Tax=Haloferax mediterranei (strain ATCC 33500 / DSM 1411 / JCM 8866 / NBRC 14739 / NCIMB 2177 / R-4) TaxID=523841 RepID=I3R6W8_HALMT|nr:hypothetical protein [Haloferax mediterranei]AFK19978.1 hypothetical protein HFX_2291 [Haloferax mediterranei ATCC 33500]AHZ23356.1 hypothetical protein BM92_12230 [Haloferax mediterranei ATCC 33500]ELZ99524.1 hypothetical protein C439_13259 [Haloferax mediterranei ATCC 33500]MDX5987270.1 hypothetical protein [Haloferax mediterranei ATCC 33500]QCQ73792.1 hypothetical protein E6P09_00225 [Haloferax mediterranei ATCC 33500]
MGYTLQYYDLVLAGIFGSLAAGVLVGHLTPIALTTSLVVFSFLAAGVMGHGLFINGPVDEAADLTNEVDALN